MRGLGGGRVNSGRGEKGRGKWKGALITGGIVYDKARNGRLTGIGRASKKIPASLKAPLRQEENYESSSPREGLAFTTDYSLGVKCFEGLPSGHPRGRRLRCTGGNGRKGGKKKGGRQARSKGGSGTSSIPWGSVTLKITQDFFWTRGEWKSGGGSGGNEPLEDVQVKAR